MEAEGISLSSTSTAENNAKTRDRLVSKGQDLGVEPDISLLMGPDTDAGEEQKTKERSRRNTDPSMTSSKRPQQRRLSSPGRLESVYITLVSRILQQYGNKLYPVVASRDGQVAYLLKLISAALEEDLFFCVLATHVRKDAGLRLREIRENENDISLIPAAEGTVTVVLHSDPTPPHERPGVVFQKLLTLALRQVGGLDLSDALLNIGSEAVTWPAQGRTKEPDSNFVLDPIMPERFPCFVLETVYRNEGYVLQLDELRLWMLEQPTMKVALSLRIVTKLVEGHYSNPYLFVVAMTRIEDAGEQRLVLVGPHSFGLGSNCDSRGQLAHSMLIKTSVLVEGTTWAPFAEEFLRIDLKDWRDGTMTHLESVSRDQQLANPRGIKHGWEAHAQEVAAQFCEARGILRQGQLSQDQAARLLIRLGA